MTDQPTRYRSPDARTLTIIATRGWGKPDHVHLSIEPEPAAIIGAAPFSMFVPTARLLAMIDAADPDAMRAYLRETLAAERLEAIPEADSPEDVDELPNVEQARAAGEQIGKIMRAFGDAYAEAMRR